MIEKSIYDALEARPVAFGSIRVACQQFAKYGSRLLRQFLIAAILVFAVGGYYEHKLAEAGLARLEAQKVIAAMKAEEADAAVLRTVQAPFASSCSSIRRAI